MSLWEVLTGANSPNATAKSVTRRITAIFIMFLTFLLIVAICVIWKIDKEWAEFILLVAQDFKIGWAFIALVAFFFGDHVMQRMKKKETK